ncbi:hypothetical protein [Bacillus pseudomycoides]|uniref:hypothetical protein n=1 Tax=Bacillus pseudomycoides TaxID=64104 RepID=UPI00211D65DC|nr:hypothetical protein [Bacillus pseudomycoides]
MSDDEMLLQKLKSCQDEEITSLLATLHPGVVLLEENEQDYDICYLGGKESLIDLSVYVNGKIYKASSLSEYVRLCNQNIYLKIKEL